MSKAFDTIDHFTLLTKMEYYSSRGPSLAIFKTYLSNCKQFFKIDTCRSQLKNSLNCSIIQGSKMSGLLYTIYTNKIPLLHTHINNDIFTNLRGLPKRNTNNIEHNTVNFVDDSTNIISSNNNTEIQNYINKFYPLLEAVYNINKLIINKDETELMIVCKNRFRKTTKNIQMYASGYKVNQVPKVKILGHIIQSNLHNDKQINKTISNINNRLYKIKKLGTQTQIKSHTFLVKAIVIGQLNYALALLSNSTKAQL